MSAYAFLKDLLDVFLVPIVLAALGLWLPLRWQHKQKELEIKTKLVSEISESVMKTVMTVYLYIIFGKQSQQNMGNDSQQEKLDQTYKKWKVDSCIIGSKIHAYFPAEEKGKKQIHRKWLAFSDRLSKYYRTTREIQKEKNECELEEEKEEVLSQKAEIIQEILVSRITGFRRIRRQQ
jgi:hypothetical protein